ncbi:transcriptional repressor [Leuconostoc citreum]
MNKGNTKMNQKYQEGLDIIKKSKLKITKKRLTLLAYLADFSEEYVSVTSVNSYMHSIYPTASHNTIYNNIKEFVSLGIIEQRNKDGKLSVKYQCDFNQIHHGHFFCNQCNRVIKISGDTALNKLLGMDSFEFSEVHLEVFGTCDQCMKNKNS